MNTREFTLDWLENPEVFRVNRLDAHSDHWFYDNLEEMYLEEKMPLRQCLMASGNLHIVKIQV